MSALLAPEPDTAAELAGPLLLPAQRSLTAFSLDELEEVARGLMETSRDALFGLADVLLEVCCRAGERPSDRTRALHEFAGRVGISEPQARAFVRVARTFPPDERARFPEFSWGHFRVLTERSSKPDDTPVERVERVRELAERASDEQLGVRGTARMVEEAVRPEALPPREELLRRVSDGLAVSLWKRHPEHSVEYWGGVAEAARAHVERALSGLVVIRA